MFPNKPTALGFGGKLPTHSMELASKSICCRYLLLEAGTGPPVMQGAVPVSGGRSLRGAAPLTPPLLPLRGRHSGSWCCCSSFLLQAKQPNEQQTLGRASWLPPRSARTSVWRQKWSVMNGARRQQFPCEMGKATSAYMHGSLPQSSALWVFSPATHIISDDWH